MMCSLFKKGLVGAAGAAVAMGLLFGTSAPSYVKAYFGHVRKHVQKNVPIEVEIERARQEIADLEPAIHDGIEAVAKAETEVKYLDTEIAAHRVNIETQQRQLVALREAIDTGYRRTDGSDRSEHLKATAARRLDAFKVSKQLLAQKEDTLEMKRQQVESSKENLEKLMDQKKILAAKVEQIETQLKQIRNTEASNEFSFDDTALSHARQTVFDLEKRLDQMARVAEYEGRLVDKDLPTIIEPSRDVAREIDAELSRTPASPGDKPL